MDAMKLYFDPERNRITGEYMAGRVEIQKADVARLVRAGAEVEDSAREANQVIKQIERQQ